jgi:hypothetical protein
MKEAFSLLDTEQGGTLTQEVFTSGLQRLGFKGDTEGIYSEMDKQRAGSINLRDFMLYFTTKTDWKSRESPFPSNSVKPQDLTEVVAVILADIQKLRDDVGQFQTEGKSQHHMILQAVESRPLRVDIPGMVREEIERHVADLDKIVDSAIERLFPSKFSNMREAADRMEVIDGRVTQMEASVEMFADDEVLRLRCKPLFEDMKQHGNLQALDDLSELRKELETYGGQIKALEQNAKDMDKKHKVLVENAMGGIREVLAKIDIPTPAEKPVVSKPAEKPVVTLTSSTKAVQGSSLTGSAKAVQGSWSPLTAPEVVVNATVEEKISPPQKTLVTTLGQETTGSHIPPGTIDVKGSPVRSPAFPSSPTQAFPFRHTLPTIPSPPTPQRNIPEPTGSRDDLRVGPRRQHSTTRASSPSPPPPMVGSANVASPGSIHIVRAPSPERSPLLVGGRQVSPSPSPQSLQRSIPYIDAAQHRPMAPDGGSRVSFPQRQPRQWSMTEARSSPPAQLASSSSQHGLHGNQHASLAQGWSALRQTTLSVAR